jgi:hypothetical protein
LVRKVGDLVTIESFDSIWRFNNTSLTYLDTIGAIFLLLLMEEACIFSMGKKIEE